MKALSLSTLLSSLLFLTIACGTTSKNDPLAPQIQKVAKTNYSEVTDQERFNDTFTKPIPKLQPTAFTFSLPEGWAEAEKQQFRDINISFAKEPQASCYLTILPLKGGAVLLNLNRWRGQFNLPPLNALPDENQESISFLEKNFPLFSMEGDFKPLEEAGKNFIGYGILGNDSENAYSIKFTGPAEFLKNEKNNFKNWVGSLKKSNATSTPNPSPKNLPTIPENLQWSKPESWESLPATPPRIALFKPIQKNTPECSISLAKGSTLENLNRWRKQMGLAPVSNIEEQPKEIFSCPIGKGLFVFLEGPFSGGMSGKPIENAILLGAIIEGDNQSIFIKMADEKELVNAEKGNFLKFITSIQGKD